MWLIYLLESIDPARLNEDTLSDPIRFIVLIDYQIEKTISFTNDLTFSRFTSYWRKLQSIIDARLSQLKSEQQNIQTKTEKSNTTY